MTIAMATFALSLAVCVYLYVGYPLLVFVLGRIRQRPVRATGDTEPTVTVLIPAFNEAAVIDAKIRNTLTLEYPGDRLETLVVSDGSTDGTVAIARRYADRRMHVLDLPRGGKAAALNAGARAASGDILVLTDANSLLEPDALRQLVRSFADPDVGGVCGNKRFRAPAGADATAEGEGLYWKYDTWQKEQETRIGSIFAADGTLHAVRRSLYVPIDDPAQADDIAISTRVVLQGARLIYEPAAIAWEEAPVEGRDEFRRKIRVTNHSVRALLNLHGALWASGFYSVELISHKLLRHLAPFFLLPLLLSSAVLAPVHPVFAAVLAIQVVFYGLALAGAALRATPAGRLRIFSVPYYFTLVNAAAFAGVLSIVTGRRQHAWTPRHGLGAILVAAAMAAGAQSAGAQTRPPVDVQVRASAGYNDNFFQGADNATESVWARNIEARVSGRSDSGGPAPFGRFEFVSYSGLDPSGGVFGGVRRDERGSAYLVEGGYQWNRPRFDIGEAFEHADIVGLRGEYARRVTSAVEVKALGEFFHEAYEIHAANTNDRYNVGGAMRYRGWGSGFSPEVGWTWGRRTADAADENFGQQQLYVQVRSAALPSTYLSVRFRRRLRDYSDALPGTSNEGREDRRNEWTAYAEVTVARHVAVMVSYWRERANSTRQDREFSAQAVGFGMTYRF